ncbi:hypothetical protein [Nocardiopsis sp. ATB16-24]|uniref:hypothetical protein n=1 Tax=Nocardiopsis sp. ATB16-24 TaxID=3019555 RepID=UPI002553C88F|nr:hypothetical protein [Nocardiopsis sp. ATB16-24]
MSNPTFATKLAALVKGIFGRKAAPAADTAAEDKAATTTAPAVEETSSETVTAAAPEEEKSQARATEPVAEEKAAKAPTEETEKPEDAGSPAEEKAEKAPTEETEKTEKGTGGEAVTGQEPRTEPATPATAELGEDAPAIAEELEAAEAHTTVASDEVLEKVRKDAAPSAEELAVPTYDELTLPSIRARLRKLTVEQVRDLRAYEVAHQGRPEFIKMYDNRITKLENAE